LNLLVKVLSTGFDFLWQWVAVVWGTAFHYVGNVHIRSGQANQAEEAVQQLARRPYKGTPLLVFMEPRAFSNEQYLRVV
jgi:hypothetical protein